MSNNSNVSPKSIRIPSEIIDQLTDEYGETGLSKLVNRALSNDINRKVWVSNLDIHQYAKLKAEEFYSRMHNVQFLRKADALLFTFYPTSKDEMKGNKRVYDYINGDFNAIHDNYVYFSVKFPVDLYHFLKLKSWDEVQSSIVGCLAFHYWLSEEHEKSTIERNVEPEILRKAIQLTKTDEFKGLKEGVGGRRKLKNRVIESEAFLRTMYKLGIDPIIYPFLASLFDRQNYPFRYQDEMNWQADFEVKLSAGYMRNLYDSSDDWQAIIINATSKDSLKRNEGSKWPLLQWRSDFEYYNNLE